MRAACIIAQRVKNGEERHTWGSSSEYSPAIICLECLAVLYVYVITKNTVAISSKVQLKGFYMGTEQALHRIYPYKSLKVTTTKHVPFDERQLSFLQRPI